MSEYKKDCFFTGWGTNNTEGELEMKKTIKVLVAGVPSVGREMQEWRKKMTFKVSGRKPQAPADKRFEAFELGLTNWIRKKTIKSLQNSVELLRRDIIADVQDAGEIILPDAPAKYEGKVGFDEESMVALSKEFARVCKDYDVVILLGGDHAGGMLLYALEGKVARFDQHSDACETPQTCSNEEVARNTYVCAAIRALKKEEDIYGIGIREGKTPYQRVEGVVDVPIFDIDLDVLAEKYAIKTAYNKGKLSPDDLVAAVRKNKPRAIGIFEIVKDDAKAALLVEKLCEETVIARALSTRKKKG